MTTPDSNPEHTSNPPPGRRAFLKASSFASVLAATPGVLVGLITTASGDTPVHTTAVTTANTDKKMRPKSPDDYSVTGTPLKFKIGTQDLQVSAKLTASVKVGDPAPKNGNHAYTIKATAVQSGYSDVPDVTFSFTANCNAVSGEITHLTGSSGGGDKAADRNPAPYRIWVVPIVGGITDQSRTIEVAVYAQVKDGNGQWQDVPGTVLVNGVETPATAATATLTVEWEKVP